MPVLSGLQLQYWRMHPQITDGYLVAWVPDRVVRRRVNQASFTYPVSEITFDNPDGDTGDVGDVEAGMLIQFLSSSGVPKGTGRVRAVSGSTLTIHPVGLGDVAIRDNDIIDIFDMYQPYALLPYISPDGTLYKDYDVAFAGQTNTFPPVANANPDRLAGRVDASTGKLRVTFDAQGWLPSFAVADGATISQTLWDVKDGTFVTGDANSSQIVVDFPAGKRWVKLTVTDSNGSTAIKRVPIWAANTTTYAPMPARLSRRGYSGHNTGWELSAELLGDTSEIPEHALIIFWKDEWFGAWHGSVSGTSTAFVGWVADDLLGMEPLWSDDAVNARGPLAVLQQRPAFPQTVRRTASPSNWSQVTGLDWWKTVLYLLKFHSNILDLCDIERPAFYADYPVPRLDSQAGTLYDQVQFLADAVFGAFTADACGRLFLRRSPHLMLSAERSAWTPILGLTAGDLVGEGQGPRFERAAWDALAWLRGGAIVADAAASTAVQAISPGPLPGQGPGVETIDRRLVTSQYELNQRLGHLYAYRQGHRDGRRVMRRGTLTLAHGGDVVDPAWQEVVTLTLAANTNRRGVAFDAARLVPVALDVTHEHETGTVTHRLTVEEETRGELAETVVVDTGTVDDQPPVDYEPPVLVDPPAPPPPTGGSGSAVAFLAADGYAANQTSIRRARTFMTAATRVWEPVFVSTTDVGTGWVIRAFQCDNWDPRHKAQVVVTNQSNETRVYTTSNLDDTTPTWTLKATLPYNGFRVQLWISVLPDTAFLLIEPGGGSNSHVFHTHDGWETVTSALNVTGERGGSVFALAISNHSTRADSGLVAVTYHGPDIARSLDYGANFSPTGVGLGGFYTASDLLIPYQGNESDLMIFALGGSASIDEAYVQFSQTRGGAWEDRTPSYDYGLGPIRHGGGRMEYRITKILVDYTQDSAKLAGMFSPSGKYNPRQQRIFVSDDRGVTWTHQSLLDGIDGYMLGGWPYDVNVLYITCRDRLIVSTDRGLTWQRIEWNGYVDGVSFVPIWKT